MTVEKFARELDALLANVEREHILLMRDGKPLALVIGVGEKDEEDIGYENSPEFWQMIRERRKEATVPFSEVLAQLAVDEAAEKKQRKADRTTGKKVTGRARRQGTAQ